MPGKPPGGWGFLSPIFVQASLNKNPTLKFPPINYSFFRTLLHLSDVENDQGRKRQKLQQLITSIFVASEPKFDWRKRLLKIGAV